MTLPWNLISPLRTGKSGFPSADKRGCCFPTRQSRTSKASSLGVLKYGWPGPGQHPQINTLSLIVSGILTPTGFPENISPIFAPPLFSGCLALSCLSAQRGGDALPAASPERVSRASSLSHLPREQANSISVPFDAASALASTFGASVRSQFTFQSVIRDPRSLPEAKITHHFTSN